MSSVIEKPGRISSTARASCLPLRKKEIVEARVADRLKMSPYPEIRRVACEFCEGILFLRGRVTSYFLKQIAQTVVLEVRSFEEINNQLEVMTPSLAGKRNVLPRESFQPKGLGSMEGGIFHKEDV